MNTSGKIITALGIASSALFAAWLLTGTRKVRTRQFVVRRAITFKDAIKQQTALPLEDYEVYYI
ncbi:MAG: hypothetical protein ABI477_08455 [Chryseolinea sp.]